MDVSKIKIIAMDLDGTLTQHKEKLTPKNRETLDALAKKYKVDYIWIDGKYEIDL